MNSEKNEDRILCGISFKRRPHSVAGRFLDFLSGKGHSVSVNQHSVHVFGLKGDLEAMAHALYYLAREFDERNSTLIANALTDVWEFRECCKSHRELGSPISTLDEDPAFVATGRWRDARTLAGHRRLGQVFVAGDPVEIQTVVDA